ncbi:MAG: ThiF family adenylyltransferase [Planctomycetota bacterium]
MNVDRYHRQKLLEGVGEEGQARLGLAHVAIVGVGALGCTMADLLARAGVGTLTLIDRDLVETTNLQRQTLFTEADAEQGRPKADAAAERLGQVNSTVELIPEVADLTPSNAERLTEDADLLLDGTDNFETRFLLNDLSVKRGVPFVYCGAVAWRGAGMVIRPGETPCLRCLFDGPPSSDGETCDTVGVAGPVAMIAAANAAAEALKLLIGAHERVANSLLEFDLWEMQRRRVDVSSGRRADCPCCGARRFEFLQRSHGAPASLCGQDAVQISAPLGEPMTLDRVADVLGRFGGVTTSRFLVRGSVEDGLELTVFADGRAIVRGTTDTARARSVVSRYLGR